MRNLAQLQGRNIVVYDTEIINVIGGLVDGKTVTWDTHELMGISVACLYDYESGDNIVYLKDNLPALAARLNRADLVVAFNHIGFDNKLLRASGLDLKPDTELRNYDMLVESRKGIGWREGAQFPRGCKLDDHLKATFGEGYMKTANGEEAPKMFQAGKMGELISYCLADVARERALFEYIWMTGIVKTAHNGVHSLKHPSEMLAPMVAA